MPKLGKTALGYSVYLEAQRRDTEVSVLLKATSMDTLLGEHCKWTAYHSLHCHMFHVVTTAQTVLE